jgi:hypothetical protein
MRTVGREDVKEDLMFCYPGIENLQSMSTMAINNQKSSGIATQRFRASVQYTV